LTRTSRISRTCHGFSRLALARASMLSLGATPLRTITSTGINPLLAKKEAMERQALKDLWSSNNTPTVPHPDDPNLDESEDEDDPPVEYDGER
ncbi:hypothetical protein PENTCL1PPCAC_14338, partial [Pristionchus entomophagus]